jgi:hypothetical protein
MHFSILGISSEKEDRSPKDDRGKIAFFPKYSKALNRFFYTFYIFLQEQDLNLRLWDYEPHELPNCSILRFQIFDFVFLFHFLKAP